jgi:hypothetical protein
VEGGDFFEKKNFNALVDRKSLCEPGNKYVMPWKTEKK